MRLFVLLATAIIAILLAALSMPASAAMQYQDENVAVTFDDGPCTDPAIEQILSMSVPGEAKAKAATVTDTSGQPVAACWVDHGEKVVLVDVLGRGGYLLKENLRQLPPPMALQPAPA